MKGMPVYNKINRTIDAILSNPTIKNDESETEPFSAADSTGAGYAGAGGYAGVQRQGQSVGINPIWHYHVEEYDWLLGNLLTTDVAMDATYQKRYRYYWRMNAARLPPAYFAAYFNFLEAQKRNNQLWPDQVCAALGAAHKNLHFSFASKLAHMVKPSLPIYDRNIKDFYDFKYPSTTLSFIQRVETYMSYYDFLVDEYRRVRSCALLAPAIIAFRSQLHPKTMTDEKVIDSLIWGA